MIQSTAARRSLPLLAGFLVLATAIPALGASKRAGVPKFEGQEEALIRKKVMQVLKSKGYELVKSREIDVTLANTGALLDSEEGFAKVAKELALAVVVSGEVGKKRAKIIAHDGRDGSVLGQAVFTAPNSRKLAAEVGRDLWKKLGRDIEKGKAPAGAKKPQKSAVADSPEDDESTPDAEEAAEPAESRKKADGDSGPVATVESGDGDAPKKKKKRKKVKMEGEGDGDGGGDEDDGGGGAAGGLAAFDASVGPTALNRSFGYNDSLAGLRPYSLPMGPAISVNLTWYPLASLGGFAENLGVDIRLEYAFFISSSLGADATYPSGATFGTSVHEYSGGLRYRIPIGAGHQVFFGAGGGEHAFVFRTTNAAMPRLNLDIPDTIYRFARASTGARFDMGGGWSLTLGAGYRAVLNGGGTHFGQYFPHRSVGGLDAQAAVGYLLTEDFEVRAGVDYRRYFYSMNSQCVANGPCDQYVAGGALDQYLAFSAVIAYRFGGGAASGSDDDGAKASGRKRESSDGGSNEGEIGATD